MGNFQRPRIVTVLGTRPELIKCSTLLPRFDELFEHALVHTGQHYDEQMDAVFFRDLGLRAPDYALHVGSGSHAAQLAGMLVGIETALLERRPNLVFVQGDTNSTLAGGLAAAKLNIPVAHLEAGCRSFNRVMPEETNRVVVDHLADLLLAPDDDASDNLRREGIAVERVTIVGSTGIDACLRMAELANGGDTLRAFDVEPCGYLVATIHRAENTTPERLASLMAALADLSTTWPIIFPVHPRTAKALDGLACPAGVRQVEPVGYGTMIRLLDGCRALLTDSGGLQEEAAVLGTPTFILREETEWRAFVDAGHHQLVGTETATVVEAVRQTLIGGAREQRMREPIGRERAGATGRTIDALRGLFAARFTPDAFAESEGHRVWSLPRSISSNGHASAASADGVKAQPLGADR